MRRIVKPGFSSLVLAETLLVEKLMAASKERWKRRVKVPEQVGNVMVEKSLDIWL
jgi:hypothetical protein